MKLVFSNIFNCSTVELYLITLNNSIAKIGNNFMASGPSTEGSRGGGALATLAKNMEVLML